MKTNHLFPFSEISGVTFYKGILPSDNVTQATFTRTDLRDIGRKNKIKMVIHKDEAAARRAFETQKVIFRKLSDGEIMALFPETDEGNYRVSAFVHIGQHTAVHYTAVIDTSRPATPEEYKELQCELESAPYNYVLKIMTRHTF